MFIRILLLSFFSAGLVLSSAHAQFSDQEKKEIRSIVKDYLENNPDLLLEIAQKNDKVALLKSRKVQDFLYNNPKDNTIGPADAKIKIVEFLDYNCGYCKRSYAWLKDMVKKHPGKIRVIFKELPVLERRTKTSRQAAKAALAAGELGHYWDYHGALMTAGGKLTQERLDKIAQDLGLDLKDFHQAMKKTEREDYLHEIHLFSTRLNIRGTPSFVINDHLILGADFKAMEALINQELKS